MKKRSRSMRMATGLVSGALLVILSLRLLLHDWATPLYAVGDVLSLTAGLMTIVETLVREWGV